MYSNFGICVIAIIGVIGVFFITPSTPQQASSELLEKINVDTYLQNRRLVEFHIQCLVYNGPCDRIGNEIKRLFATFRHSGLSTTECRVCNDEQRRKLHRIAVHWQTNYPQAWRELRKIMDNN